MEKKKKEEEEKRRGKKSKGAFSRAFAKNSISLGCLFFEALSRARAAEHLP